MTRRRQLAIGSWLATVGVCIVGFIVIFATRDTNVSTSWGFRGASEIFGLTCGTIGAIVGVRRPDNLNGWLFRAIGVLFGTQGLVNEYVIAGVLVMPGGLPLATGLGWMLTWLWVPPFGISLVFLPLIFPTGRLLSRRWRVVVALGIVDLVAFGVALAFLPGPIDQASYIVNPLGMTGIDVATYGSLILGPVWLVLAIVMLLAFASVALRFRRASIDSRQQIKWFALAVLIAAATTTVYLTASVVTGSSTSTKPLEILVIVTLLGIPTAAGMAILRYRLYDIDRIVSRTISYGAVTASLVAVFLLVNLALQAVLSGLTSNNALAVAGSTLLAAALFTPLRQRVQGAVDRRFDRARYDAERTSTVFQERVRDEVDLAALTGLLDETVRRGMPPTTVGLWLRNRAR